MLNRLIHQLHDPVVGVRREAHSPFGVEAAQGVGKSLDAGRLEFLVAESIAALVHAGAHQSARRLEQAQLSLLAGLTLAREASTLSNVKRTVGKLTRSLTTACDHGIELALLVHAEWRKDLETPDA